MTLHIPSLLVLLTCAGFFTRGAQAQEAPVRERAEASFKAGAAAYAAGEYLAAIQALDAAYALTPLPAIAFSLAQAERRHYFVAHELSHLERALTLFRSYVTQVQSGGRRADALDALSQLEPLAALANAHGLAAADKTEAATQPTRLMITCEAEGARIALDGAEAGPSPLIREVEPGKHVAVVEAEGFFPARRELIALRGALILGEVALSAQPSTLSVEAPADADVYVDGSFVGQGAVRVQQSAGEHRLAVSAKGARVIYQTVMLERGRTHVSHVTLARTTQRKAAIGLFIAGGLVLAAGVVVGGLAIHYEDEAQAFLHERARGNVSARQLANYHENVDSRDLHRKLGGAGVGGAATLFVAALLMRELDRPSAQDIQRDARSLASERAQPAKRTSWLPGVNPWLSKSSIGLALSQRF
jgi:hypothetical protein